MCVATRNALQMGIQCTDAGLEQQYHGVWGQSCSIVISTGSLTCIAAPNHSPHPAALVGFHAFTDRLRLAARLALPPRPLLSLPVTQIFSSVTATTVGVWGLCLLVLAVTKESSTWLGLCMST